MKNINYPTIIYKYRDWNNPYHKNILLSNELYLSSPKDFNDPFDCRIYKNFTILDSKEKIELFIENFCEKHGEYLIDENRDVESVKNDLRKSLSNLAEFQRMQEFAESKAMDENYGILSLTARWNSILMWSHYGNNHQGFCIGFNEEKMRNSGLFNNGGPVTYRNDFPEINPLTEEESLEVMFLQTHSKAKDWTYEKEYRLIKLFYPDTPTNDERKVFVSDNLIEEVNLGLNISQENREQIVLECKRRNIPVFQLIKEPFKFELNRTKL
ncbi:DUF2971 domain-containing protein [Maribacter cobaltidurans]|uniref:DUF2971 domain-containing protein n=1 Tax=Maribacter cobaltidurans TaxID=1178778 RepID=UPI001315635A|nr:DUF2971 domain-containing protein [Maribacter cobaltidurans]